MHWFHLEIIVLVLLFAIVFVGAGFLFRSAFEDFTRVRDFEQEERRREPRI